MSVLNHDFDVFPLASYHKVSKSVEENAERSLRHFLALLETYTEYSKMRPDN